MPAFRVSPSTTTTTAVSNSKSSVTSATNQQSRPSQSESNNDENCADNINNDSNVTSVNAGNTFSAVEVRQTPYQRVLRSIESDERWKRDITLGRRVGFYRFRGDIGNGNFSHVKMAIHCLTKEKVAVKILDKCKLDAKTQRMLLREIHSMEQLHHPNLIRLFEVIENLSKIYLVMEYAPNGELFQRITNDGRLEESDAKNLFAQIVSAINHMHFHNIIHRDIKAENVFYADAKTVKVGDFGFSTEIETKQQLLSTFCGSPPYAAPELFNDESYSGPYVDYWALGVLLYFMVTAQMPFKAQTISELKKLIVEGVYDTPHHISDKCNEVIRGLLQQNPVDRLNLDDLQKTKWLSEQQFPPHLPKYQLKSVSISDIDTQAMPAYEKDAYRHLNDLGIDQTMIGESIEKGARSNITGTFRIIMHRLINLKLARDRSTDSSSISCMFNKTTSFRKYNSVASDSTNSSCDTKEIKFPRSLSKSLKSFKNLLFNDNKTAAKQHQQQPQCDSIAENGQVVPSDTNAPNAVTSVTPHKNGALKPTTKRPKSSKQKILTCKMC